MKMHALTGVEPGPEEFHAVVDAIARWLPAPRYSRFPVVLDDLQALSARLELVRLAAIVALERTARSVHVLPVSAAHSYQSGHDWVISQAGPARERTVTLAEDGDGHVRVTVEGRPIEVAVPSEQECRRFLESGVSGAMLRFPVFSSSGSSLIARTDGADELVLWRLGLPAARFRLPGPVLAATYLSDGSFDLLFALVQIGGELVVHLEGTPGSAVHQLRAPIDFSVAEEAERGLSPLYLDLDEPWRFGVRFRRAGQWWALRYDGGSIALVPSHADAHHEPPWIAVQQSPHLVEILDKATGTVLHRLST
ncbi:hypothetical protein LFM09_40510 [Lentzea alba]|uniref:hypothetical protein n=1 Tax=Lentzea alba TaxID=2714351 RepID=UPI0039BFA166